MGGCKRKKERANNGGEVWGAIRSMRYWWSDESVEREKAEEGGEMENPNAEIHTWSGRERGRKKIDRDTDS